MAARASYIYTPARLEELMDILDEFSPRQAAVKRRQWRDQDEAAGVAVEQEERADTRIDTQYPDPQLEPAPSRDSLWPLKDPWWRRWVSGP